MGMQWTLVLPVFVHSKGVLRKMTI